MDNVLTIYIVPCDDPRQTNEKRLVNSFRDVGFPVRFVRMKDRDLSKFENHETPWFGYLWSNEYISAGLIDCLSVFLQIKYLI